MRDHFKKEIIDQLELFKQQTKGYSPKDATKKNELGQAIRIAKDILSNDLK